MNLPELLALKKLVGDMRFIQAAAFVASNLNDNTIINAMWFLAIICAFVVFLIATWSLVREVIATRRN